MNDDTAQLWEMSLPFTERDNNFVTESLASTIIDRTTIIMVGHTFNADTREVLHAEVIEKLYQQYRFNKRIGSDEGKKVFNRKRRRHQRKVRVSMKRGFVDIHYRIIMNIILF